MQESDSPASTYPEWHAALGYPRLYQRNELKTELDEQNQFYTYIIWRQDGQPLTPFYVGKGRHGRALHHQMDSELAASKHKDNIIKKLMREGEPILYSYTTTANEAEAFAKEKELIQLIGRSNLGLGPLANLTDGGEGSSGHLGLRGDANPTSRAVYCNGVRYASLNDASKALGRDPNTIANRCLQGFQGFFFEDTGQLPLQDGAIERYEKVTVTPTGRFNSLRSAALDEGVSSQQLSKWIKAGRPGYFFQNEGQLPQRKHEKPVEIEGVFFESRKSANAFFGFQVRQRLASSNYPNWVDLSGTILKKEKRYPFQPTIIDGKYFSTVSAAARAMGIDRRTLTARAGSSNFPGVICEHITKLNRDSELAKDSIPVSIEGVSYPSLSAAARARHIDISTLKRRLRSSSYQYRLWVCADPDLQKKQPKDGKPGLREVVIMGQIYRSINAAAKALKLSRAKVKSRCESDAPEYTDWQLTG